MGETYTRELQNLTVCYLVKVVAKTRNKSVLLHSLDEITQTWMDAMCSVFGQEDSLEVEMGFVDCSELDELKSQKKIRGITFTRKFPSRS